MACKFKKELEAKLALACVHKQLKIALCPNKEQDAIRNDGYLNEMVETYISAVGTWGNKTTVEFYTNLFLTCVTSPRNRKNQDVLGPIIPPVVAVLVEHSSDKAHLNPIQTHQLHLLEAVLAGNKGNLKLFYENRGFTLVELYTRNLEKLKDQRNLRRVLSIGSMLKNYTALIQIKKERMDRQVARCELRKAELVLRNQILQCGLRHFNQVKSPSSNHQIEPPAGTHEAKLRAVNNPVEPPSLRVAKSVQVELPILRDVRSNEVGLRVLRDVTNNQVGKRALRDVTNNQSNLFSFEKLRNQTSFLISLLGKRKANE